MKTEKESSSWNDAASVCHCVRFCNKCSTWKRSFLEDKERSNLKKVVTLVVVFMLVSSLFSCLLPEVQAMPSLSNGYVTPPTGTTSDQFYYYVHYYDPGGLAPELAIVRIDGYGWFMTLYNGIPSNGVYRYSTTLPVGTHNYYFMFTANTYTLYLPNPSTPYSGPIVNPPQRRLTVYGGDHDSPNPPNGDWYFNDGQTVWCSVTSPVTEGGIVWTCTGWTGTGSVPPSGGGSVVSFVITQDSSITWYWYGSSITHTLTVYSAHDNPIPGNGPHMYNDGQSVTCSVTSPVTEGSTEWSCTGWSGTGSVPPSGSTTSVTFPIYQDSSITWNWEEVAPPNNPPSTPTAPSGPVFCALYNEENILQGPWTYTSSASDPEGDNVQITFSWDDGSSDSQSGWVASGDSVSVDHSWRELHPSGYQTGMHKVRTKAADINMAESDWSPPLEVTVVGKQLSDIWAGYTVELTSGSVTAIEGDWIAPHFNIIPFGNDGTWVGIGGVHGRLLQAGIAVRHFFGVPIVHPFIQVVLDGVLELNIQPDWFELPSYSISEEDLIHVSINSLGSDLWQVSVNDITKGWVWTKLVICEPDLTTAEWIHEPGANAGLPLPWSPFSPVDFTRARFAIDGTTYKVGQTDPSLKTILFTTNFQKDDTLYTNVSPLNEYEYFTISCLLSEHLPQTPITGISLYSSANLSVYDASGNHLGYNSTTGLIDRQIPNTLYFEDETGARYAILFGPNEYRIELIGNEDGDFHLHTQIVTNETVTLDQWVNDTITIDETKTYYLIHQISLQDLENSKTVTGQGYNCSISIVVFNNGNYTETFNVTAYANTTIIGTQPVTLTRRNSTTILFTWNTSGVPYGNYTISANATIVSGETDTADNTYIDGIVQVTIPGDIDGDGYVTIADVSFVAVRFGLSSGDGGWDSRADIDNDAWITIADVSFVASHFGEH